MSRKAINEAPAVPMTVAERQRRFRDARIADGWVCLSTLWLEPDAVQKLHAISAKSGESPTEIINRLLKRSRP